MNLIDRCFGNKVKIVTATKLENYIKYQRDFLFNNEESDVAICNVLKSIGFYVDKTITERNKDITAPKLGYYKFYFGERIIKIYD